MLRHIGTQVEAMLSKQISLKIHMQAIERQLAAIAARICDHDAMLLPRSIFLLLEMRGSGGVSAQLEQIACIVHEQGYWKPQGACGTIIDKMSMSWARVPRDSSTTLHRWISASGHCMLG